MDNSLPFLDAAHSLIISLADMRFLNADMPVPLNFWEVIFGAPQPLENSLVVFPKSEGISSQSYYFSFFVYETGPYAPRPPHYLMDDKSEQIQLFLFHIYNYEIFSRVLIGLYTYLKTLTTLVEFKLDMFWFLMFNMYQFPFSVVSYLTDWYIKLANAAFPAFLGMSLGPSILTFALGAVINWIPGFTFTIPYLPSEGILYGPREYIERIEEEQPGVLEILPFSKVPNDRLRRFLTEEGQVVRVYDHFPELYKKYPLPNWLREYWWKFHPEIIAAAIEKESNTFYQGEGGMKIFPNRIDKHMNQYSLPPKR